MLPKNKLNILYVGTLPPHQGGSAILAFQLLLGLAKSGHSIRAVAPITPEILSAGDSYAINYPQLNLKRFQIPYFECSPDVPPLNEYRQKEGDAIQKILMQLIAERKPDLFIIGRESFVFHVPDIAIQHTIPSILLVQGASTFGILRGTIPKTVAQKMLSQFRKTNVIIVVAKHLSHKIESFGFNHIKVIENTIDAERFYPAPKNISLLHQLNIPENAIIIAHISNLKPLKRPLDVVHSATKVLEQNPDLIYLIIGDGLIRDEIEHVCRSYNLLSKFRFVGWINYNNMPEYINLSDIVLIPSEAEARALVYLETQACGRVLIASDIPAAREVVKNGETGFLFTKGDIDDLAAKTLLAASDAKLRAEIGYKSREYILTYPLKRMVHDYETVCEEVARKHFNEF